MHDPVCSPSHYTSGDIECIDAIEASMSAEEFKGFLKGNTQKYLWRYDKKNGAEDLKKAQWYLDRLLDVRNMEEAMKEAMAEASVNYDPDDYMISGCTVRDCDTSTRQGPAEGFFMPR